MKRLVLVLNGKGGVGKSFFAVTLVQFLKDRGISHIALDTDNENSTLCRFHRETGFVDLADPRRLDALFGATRNSDLVVVDGRAASSDLFLDEFAEIGLQAVLSDLGVRLTLAIPINHEADSVDQVQRFAERLGPAVQYLIVRNAVHGGSFSLYEGLQARARLLGELGGREIDLPRMQDWLVEALNRENLSITPALLHPSINLLDRQRLLNWQRRAYTAIDSASELLMPTPEVSND